MDKAQRIGALDGIRCFAVLLVIGVHASILWPSVPKSIIPFKDGGFIGVDIFFVLSGFLISGLLLDEFKRTTRVSYLRFFAKRALRLLPPLLICLALTIAWAFRQGDQVSLYLSAALASVFNYLNWLVLSQELIPPQFGPMWSLSVEEQLYVLLAILFFVFSRAKLRSNLSSLLFIMSVVFILWSIYSRFLTASSGWSFEVWQKLYFRTDHRFGEFFTGVIAQLYRARSISKFPVALKLMQLPAVVFLLFYATQMQGDMIWHYRYGSPILSFASAVLILAATYSESLTSKFFSLRIFPFIGRLSYSMYLIHIPIFYALGSLTISGQQKFGTALVLVFLYSYVVYRLVEKPLGEVRRKYLSV
jgi:peptidoglycan/LPS O-acetylase OafA/YrhL